MLGAVRTRFAFDVTCGQGLRWSQCGDTPIFFRLASESSVKVGYFLQLELTPSL